MRRRIFSIVLVALFAVLLVKADDQFDDGIVENVEEPLSISEEPYTSPVYDPKDFYFVDHFDDIPASSKRWVKSEAKKDDIAEEIAKYDGQWEWEAPQRIVSKSDIGLALKSKAKHAAISAKLNKEFTFKEDKPLVVQYEVTMQEGQECGGSYIKLLSSGKFTEDLSQFNDKTPYTIMFGPDKCGNDHKMHFIFRHVNPINGSITEKHCRKPKERIEELFKDKLPHLYQLIVQPDNTFKIRLDNKIINEGSLLTEFSPPVNPPREIDDPEDHKPETWDDREKIPDPMAQKPDDWDEDALPQIPDVTAVMPDGWLEDEPKMIADPTAEKPDDWDTDMDGEWEAPLVDNPICEKAVGCGKWKQPLIANKEYKGKWHAPLIDNPNYQGKWAARKIPNPDFFEDLTPFKMTPISAVGIELWSMSSDILFDNLIITDDIVVAAEYAAKTFDLKRKYIDKESKTLWHRLMRHMNYKPGWWALYFVYLLIPASCYVYYLYRRAKEESFFGKLVAYGTENPWSWRIGIVLLGTPLAYVLYRFCSKGDNNKGDICSDDNKKTDAMSEDDVTSTTELSQEASNESSGGNAQTSSPKKKKSDLDLRNDERPNSAVPKDSESNDENDETEANNASSGGTTRKRRVRKDLD